MKKSLYLSVLLISLYSQAQVNWQTYPGAPTSGFWDMDTLDGKLYVSTGLVREYDGSTWNTLNNYNNSSNTPNKDKSCIKNLQGALYAGSGAFNTSGKGDMHYYKNGSWTLHQNSNFPYTGNYKIRCYSENAGTIYMAGLFEVPGNNGFRNVAKWDGSEWVNIGRNFGYYPPTTEIKDMESYQGKVYITEGNNVWAYNGTNWDSLFYPSNGNINFPMGGGISDMVVYRNKLYISGIFNLDQATTNVLLVSYDGSSFNAIEKKNAWQTALSSGLYETIGKMGVVGDNLYFF